MNFIEDQYAEMIIASDPLRATAYQGQIDEFDTAAEFSYVLSLVKANPHKFLKMIKMAEVILSVRDIMWQENEGNC
jgi:hypothetical protein